jgi:hypothetical protein
MNGQPRVSALPRRQSAPSANCRTDRARISLPGKPSWPIVALITRPSGECRVNRIVLALGITLGLTSCVTEEVIDITALTPASSGVCDQQFSGLQNSQCLWVRRASRSACNGT